jgi:organic radical activating enzyme
MSTRSLCNICYKEIPADVAVGDMVYIIKECKEHGAQIGIVEKSPVWYDCCKKINSPNFYPGVLIDVCDCCDLTCKYCYHVNNGYYHSIQDIVASATKNLTLSPFILTGGEPLLHPEIIEIVKQVSALGETFLLTNGTKANSRMVEDLCNNGLLKGNILNLGLSYHLEAESEAIQLLLLLRDMKLTLYTAFYVIDDLKQIDRCIRIYEDYSDVINIMRIKAASNLGNEKGATNKIFTSDMVNYIYNFGNTVIDTRSTQKISYAGLIHNNLTYRLISWYDKYNVDLNDIACPPYYVGRDGKVRDMVSYLIESEKANCE